MENKNKTPQTKNNSYPVVIGVGLLLLILGITVFLPCPTKSQYIVFRIVLSLAVAGVASIIPGFFMFKYKSIIRAGGALAVFAFTFIYTPDLIDTTDKCNNPFNFTLFIEDNEGKTPLKSEGELIYRLQNEKRTEKIDGKGSVTIKQIPATYKNDSLDIELLAFGWQFTNGKVKTTIALNGKYAIANIERDNSLCCVYGDITDTHGKALSGVKVRVGSFIDTTNSNGSYKIELPKQYQKESQRVIASYTDEYKVWDRSINVLDNPEVSIVLQETD